jgi:hypothetical protein
MTDEESPRPKLARINLSELLERIKADAVARAPEVDVPDRRALAGEDDLVSVGETWLRQEIRHTKHLHWIRIIVLVILLLLAGMWLLSVWILLLAVGFKWGAFALSDTVLVTYMGTTTASVLGLFHIAAKWLFSAGFVDFARSIKDLLTKDAPKT